MLNHRNHSNSIIVVLIKRRFDQVSVVRLGPFGANCGGAVGSAVGGRTPAETGVLHPRLSPSRQKLIQIDKG